MKFHNHSLVAGIIGACLGLHPIALAGMLFGSLLPDRIDFKLSMGIRPLFNQIHRGVSHWPGLYLTFLIPLLFVPGIQGSWWGMLVVGTLSGAFVHVLSDMLTMSGIPAWPIKKRVSLRFFATGSFTEYLFVWFFVAVCLLIQYVLYLTTGSAPILSYSDIANIIAFH